jgi:hypothetical protein
MEQKNLSPTAERLESHSRSKSGSEYREFSEKPRENRLEIDENRLDNAVFESKRLRELRSELSPDSKEKKKGKTFFEPEQEVEAILASPSKKRPAMMREYKQKFLEQRVKLMEIERMLSEQIIKNPDKTKEQLINSIAGMKGKLSAKQQEAVDNALDLYIRQHAAIRSIVGESKKKKWFGRGEKVDAKKLYAELFGRRPKGKINVIIGPMSIHFRTTNPKDYYLDQTGPMKNESMKDYFGKVPRSQGVFLSAFPYPGLEDAITLENGAIIKKGYSLFKRKEVRKQVYIHESQHVFNALIRKSLLKSHLDSQPRAYSGEENSEKSDSGAMAINNLMDSNIEERISDEISAFFKEGYSTKQIRNMFLNKYSAYNYGSEYRFGSKNIYDDHFKKEYVLMVENAIVAFKDLLKAGYSMDECQAFLNFEPLPKWPKAVDRMLERKKPWKKMRKEGRKLRPLGERFRRFITFKRD